MQAIGMTIKLGDSGPKVRNLIDCLLLLVERGGVKTFTAPGRPTSDELKQLTAKVQQDLSLEFFGEAVKRLAWDFQTQQGLGDDLGGVVEQKTATRLNEVLRSLGVDLDPQDHEVFGLAIDATGRRIANLDIRAFDRDFQCESVLGQAITNGAGAYSIVFPASLYRKTAAERGGPDLIVRAFDDKGLLLAHSAMAPNAGMRTELNLSLDADMRLVIGTVSDDSGNVLPHLRIRAIDRDLRSEEPLGEALTDAGGRYQIRYTPAQFRRAEKTAADLRVRVFTATGERELVESATLFNAPSRATIDLSVPAAALHTDSEWERYLRELSPLLENLQLHELNDEDLQFLVGEIGIDATHLRMLRLDAQWREQQAQHKLPAAAFYGLLRQGLPVDWALLLQAGPSRWRAALKQAIADKQAPSALAQVSEAFVAKLTELAIDHSFVAPSDGSGEEPRIGVLLAGSTVNIDVQRQIAGVMLHRSPDDDPQQLWQSLAQAGVPDDAVRSARFALEAHGLVHQHLPTLATLQASLARGFGAGADLARLGRVQWLEVAQTVAGTGAKALPKGFGSAEQYAQSLADRVELAFPTAVVAHRLVEDAQPLRSDVGLLLTLNPGFDLLTSPIDQFMPTAELGQIKTPREALTKQLATEIRVARIAPASNRAQHMQTLQTQGFDSATKVVMAGDVAFKSRIRKIAGAAVADEIYANAKLRAADLTVHTLRLRDYLEGPLPVLPSADVAPRSRLADWVEMFGSANGCFCPPCESVHGPGAYLMDLLQYLKEMKARRDDDSADAPSLFDRLDSRRPDLKHLKLNCANAQTPLPYIDLVNELLEREIAGGVAHAIPTPQTPDALDETDDVAARLRALPEENNAIASAVYGERGSLQSASYPWQLPFDRGFLQAGIYFTLIGTSAAEVLALSAEPGDALHRARLGLDQRTWALLHDIEVRDAVAVAHFWGLTALAEEPAVGPRLDVFGGEQGVLLARSGLPVESLFALVESPLFEGWALYVDRRPDPCNIDHARLTQRNGTGAPANLNLSVQTEVFDLMHRVLRLRMALGWPIERLVLALHALGVGKDSPRIDLVALSRMEAVSARVGASVERLSELIRALDHNTPDPNLAAHTRSAWLALLRLSEPDHGHLVALQLPDSLAAPDSLPLPDGPLTPAKRLERLEAVLDTLALLQAANLDPAELRYLLRHHDLTPAVFTPRDATMTAQLRNLVADILGATADLSALPADASAAAAVERLKEITGTSFVVTVISDTPASGPEPRVDALLRAQLGDSASAGGVLQDFIKIATEAANVDAAVSDARLIAALLRVQKTCRLLSALRFTDADVRALARLQTAGGALFDFNTLPVIAATTGSNLEELHSLVVAGTAQAAMPTADQRLLDIIALATDATDANDVTIALERQTGWGQSIAPGEEGFRVLQGLATALGMPGDSAAAWRSPDTYMRLQAAVRWLQQRRLMLAPDNALSTLLLAAGAEPAAGVAPLQALARSRFATSADWFKALAPSMDRLRIRQRDALLAHILHTNSRGWKTADDVYAHLLIDVQMGPCQLSSRLVQAHAAVQLFVQRCLMNLEEPDEISLGNVSDIAQWRQWDWIKNYRVWEAGRKVFLYPENWIEPDLRDVKSPFFEDLENELLQDEITPDTVERAVRSYLSKLHDVARLDVRAMFEETTTEHGRKVIHMVGRTRAVPHVYFYRKRLDDLSWTPWEKIDLSIDADQLVLVVHNGRPTMFWPQFKEVQVGRSDPPLKKWEVSLSWSVRDPLGWQAPRSGSASVSTLRFDKEIFSLRPEQRGRQLALKLLSPLSLDLLADAGVQGLALIIYGLLLSAVATTPTAAHEFGLDVCVGDTEAGLLPLPWTSVALPRGSRLLGNKVVASSESASALFLTTQDLLGQHYEPDASNVILRTAPPGHSLLPTHQYPQIKAFQPIVFSDNERQFLATQEHMRVQIGAAGFRSLYLQFDWYRFSALYHPFACLMLKALDEGGLAALYRSPDRLDRETVYFGSPPDRFPRQLTHEAATAFSVRYAPTWIVWQDEAKSPYVYPFEEFDFDHRGAYSIYNWEVFFHIPLLLADRLSKNGRFEDAQQWFHTIFDPTDVSSHGSPQKFWRVKPLFVEGERWSDRDAIESLEAMMRRLSHGADDVQAQVDAWRNDPFNPHLIAQLRLAAYMKVVVQKYIENLTAWADSLFHRDTMESINEATQLYVLGNEILGTAPVVLPPMQREGRSYDELTQAGAVDDFSNVLISIETSLPVSARPAGRAGRAVPGVSMLCFCIPSNPRLQELRGTIADRLFKIRHCMDIEGRTRQLALFAPSIDPALLVRARAAGLDIGTALTMALGTRPPHYRFQPLLQKALEFCGEVRSFGNALLSALEKRDGEQLAQLRARHEIGILKLVSHVKKQQVTESEANREAAQRSRAVVQARLDFYGANLKQGQSPAEAAQISQLRQAHELEVVSASHNALASILHALPTAVIGFPNNGTEWGGPNLGHATQAAGSVFGLIAQQWAFEASMSGYNATYGRRADEWRHQIESASRELAQFDQQIVAAEIRLAIAEQDLKNHEQQIAQAEEIQASLRDKFTSVQLYSWMSTQLAALHYQSYRMAFDLAKQAEAAADLELDTGPALIRLDHWDGGRKGLLAGERLAQDLRQLELAYMQRNTRALEMTSNISLRRLDPNALWNLRVDGACEFTLPGWLFDLDFPGHQRRRIKSLSISVPGVVGPYGGVNGMLTCTSESPSRTIATSSGQNDAGVFQLDFRDDRYLPFEGVSLDGDTRWAFSLPAVFRPFNYDTISDVVLHVQFTARHEGARVAGARADVIAALTNATAPPLRLLISVRHDFPDESRQLREGGASEMTVALGDRLFPYFARNRVSPTNISRLQSSGAPDVPAPTISAVGDESRLLLRTADAEAFLVVDYALQPPGIGG